MRFRLVLFSTSCIHYIPKIILGWADDSIFIRRSDQEQDSEVWKQNGSPSVNPGAFTTGRGRPSICE